jgi:tetratricopeptide (TPR) repeat protein
LEGPFQTATAAVIGRNSDPVSVLAWGPMVEPRIAWTMRQPWIIEAPPEGIASSRAGKAVLYVTEQETNTLLAGDPKRAETRAREALQADPADTQARVLLGAALRQQNRPGEARAILESVVRTAPHMAFALRELGLVLAALGRPADAIDALLRAIDLLPLDRRAWFCLGDLLEADGPDNSAVPPHASAPDLRMDEARSAFRDGRLPDAETLLRDELEASPDDGGVLKLLSEVLLRRGRWRDAMPLLERCAELMPDDVGARFRYASMQFVFNRFVPALPHISELLKRDPANRIFRIMKAVSLSRSRDIAAAISAFEALLADHPEQPGMWVEYAWLLKFEQSEGVLTALDRATQIMPTLVHAYLTAAFTKSIGLDDAFVNRVQCQVARQGLSYEDRARLHFALGKAFEDMKRYAEAFEQYRLSNDILCTGRDFGPERGHAFKQNTKRFFTPQFFRGREGWGSPAPDPIFVVGMPRSGSTLVEQILASHSKIEGLGELRDLQEIATKPGTDARQTKELPYPTGIGNLDADRVRALGEEYLKRTRSCRKTGKPFFTDKMPGNYSQIAFIHLVLPNARIIDVRRHPLDCCVSCFKHYFPAGQPLSTNLREVGRAYVEYVELMAFFDEILPGRVHRVIYEQLVDDPEREVRRLLDHIGLPFEEQCLRFHENKRFVMTMSQDQVRMPLYKTGKEQWRNFEPWLGPLKEELGYVLDRYPDVPRYFAEIHVRNNEPLALGQGANLFATVRGTGQAAFYVPRESENIAANPTG